MAQLRGGPGGSHYQMGSGYGVPNNSATNDPSPLEQIRVQTNKIEDFFDSFSEPLKPYVLLRVYSCQILVAFAMATLEKASN
jgi:hypothetical protein